MSLDTAYFCVDRDLSDNYFAEWQDFRVKLSNFEDSIASSYKANALYKKGDVLIGYGVQNVDRISDRRGFNCKEISEGKNICLVYTPDARYREGKKFKELMNEHQTLVSRYPVFSIWFCNKFNLHRCIAFKNKLHTSVSGFVKKQIVCLIPFDMDPMSENALPKIPSFLKRIKKSEYIALTEG